MTDFVRTDEGPLFPRRVPSLIGEDFGTVPFGIAQVEAHRLREVACCGDPGDCVGPCSEPKAFCICDPDLLALEISDVRCPRHGLVAFLKGALTREAVTGESL